MLERRGKRRRVTLGADKAYDVAAFVDALRRDEQDETGASIRVRRAAVAWNGGRA